MADENIQETAQPVEGQEGASAPDAGAPESPSQASISHEVARLTRSNAEERAKNAALLAVIQAGGKPEKEPAPKTEALGPPRRENFPDDFAFFEAQQQHAFKGIEQKVSHLVEEQIQARRQRFEQEQRDQALRNSYNKGIQKHPDFEIVVQDSATTITNPMVNMMSEHENPEDIYYWLAQKEHRAEAARIASLSPARAAHEIGKIAENLKAKATEPMEPMKPLSGGGGAPAPSLYDTTNPASDRLGDDDWFRLENERVRKMRGLP